MYCPSCDKTYGAIHSRCPECHSWLKVSAPSSARSKASKASGGSSGGGPGSQDGGGVSTLDRESGGGISWADPEPSGGSSQWSSGGNADSSGGWSTGSIGSSESESWGGGSSSAGEESSWGGGDGWGGQPTKPPAAAPASPRGGGGGWLGDPPEDNGWSGAGAATKAPVDKAKTDRSEESGWLGGGGDAAGAGASPRRGGSDYDSNPSNWQVGEVDPNEDQTGWLSGGGGGGAKTESRSTGGGGWLGDPEPTDSPSMTEMVDHAISVEEDDEFVDDSWVDEEIRDSEFDELEVPEFVPPAPEVGGVFLKMLLVAVLVLLVGGGFMFLRQDTKSPEETAAEARQKKLDFAHMAIDGGKEDLKNGKADLAIPQFEQALVALSEVKAPQEEIYETEVLLGRSLMEAQEYEDAYEHWQSLKDSGQEAYQKEAVEGMNESGKQMRIVANGVLKEGKKYAAGGEVGSVQRLGREALKTYQKYDGSKSQIGDSYGVIGRGYLNGREYGPAKDYFKKAIAFAPSLGYQKYLNEANSHLRPKSYIQPIRQAPAVRRQPRSAPSLDLGQPDYQRRTAPVRRYNSSTSNNSQSTSSQSQPQTQQRKMKEIPIYRRNNGRNSGQRKGQQGVLNSY